MRPVCKIMLAIQKLVCKYIARTCSICPLGTGINLLHPALYCKGMIIMDHNTELQGRQSMKTPTGDPKAKEKPVVSFPRCWMMDWRQLSTVLLPHKFYHVLTTTSSTENCVP